MSGYDHYDGPTRERERGSHRHRDDRRDDRDPRYVESQESTYMRYPSRDLVPTRREDTDLSVEEVRRDFPPPGYGSSREMRRRDDYYDDYADRGYRSRGSDRYYDDDYDRESDRRSRKKGGGKHYNDEDKTRKRVLSQQQKILAALAGAALPVIAKEIFDRRTKEEGGEVHRNPLASASLAAAGAAAAYGGAELYNKHAGKEEKKSHYIAYRGRDGKATDYSSDDEDERSKKGNKSFIEGALATAGIGGLVKTLTGGGSHDDKKSDTHSRRGSGSKGGETAQRVQKAAMASLLAGATEAFRLRNQPGKWEGEKIKRVITAATTAGGIGSVQDPDKHSKRHLVESVIGGLVGNRMMHGSKKDIEEDKKTGRSRSRSRARSEGGGGVGLPALLTAGLGALGAKKLIDGHNERSRSRGRDRSVDSNDSRDGSPRRRQRSRSRSVVDSVRNKLAKVGIGNGADEDRNRDRDRDRRRDLDDDEPRNKRHHRDSHRDSDDEYDDDYPRSHGGNKDRGRDDDSYDDEERSHRGGGRAHERERHRGGHRSASGSDTDLGDSDADEKRGKKMRDSRRRH